MEPFAATSAFSALAADAREWLAALKFARPGVLWLLLLSLPLALLNWWAARRSRAALALIGRPGAVAGQLTHPRPRSRWRGASHSLAWALLVLGTAGPRWGKSDEAGVAVGRDLVLVIDLSQSMRADDMSDPKHRTRWAAARAGALDLLDTLAQRGGHRVAVIAFAAKPKLLCPLTTDYDHARAAIEDLDGDAPPAEIRPGTDPNATSGTRIGAALIAAVEAHDKRFTGSQDIVLISDGDDPGNDDEWVRGANVARAANIPVHTVGVGNHTQPRTIEVGVRDKNLVATQLQEAPLKLIATDTRGEYVPARRDVPQLGEFFRKRIEPNATREISDDRIPLPKERYAWFLAPALALFLWNWLRGR